LSLKAGVNSQLILGEQSPDTLNMMWRKVILWFQFMGEEDKKETRVKVGNFIYLFFNLILNQITS
jgi:hypothetical protein